MCVCVCVLYRYTLFVNLNESHHGGKGHRGGKGARPSHPRHRSSPKASADPAIEDESSCKSSCRSTRVKTIGEYMAEPRRTSPRSVKDRSVKDRSVKDRSVKDTAGGSTKSSKESIKTALLEAGSAGSGRLRGSSERL